MLKKSLSQLRKACAVFFIFHFHKSLSHGGLIMTTTRIENTNRSRIIMFIVLLLFRFYEETILYEQWLMFILVADILFYGVIYL
jgi:hypothetical protein